MSIKYRVVLDWSDLFEHATEAEKSTVLFLEQECLPLISDKLVEAVGLQGKVEELMGRVRNVVRQSGGDELAALQAMFKTALGSYVERTDDRDSATKLATAAMRRGRQAMFASTALVMLANALSGQNPAQAKGLVGQTLAKLSGGSADRMSTSTQRATAMAEQASSSYLNRSPRSREQAEEEVAAIRKKREDHLAATQANIDRINADKGDVKEGRFRNALAAADVAGGLAFAPVAHEWWNTPQNDPELGALPSPKEGLTTAAKGWWDMTKADLRGDQKASDDALRHVQRVNKVRRPAWIHPSDEDRWGNPRYQGEPNARLDRNPPVKENTDEPMTLAVAKQTLRALGLVISHDPSTQEFRVAFAGRGPAVEASAYYTNDLQDAVNTGRAMAQHRNGQVQENCSAGAVGAGSIAAVPMGLGTKKKKKPKMIEFVEPHSDPIDDSATVRKDGRGVVEIEGLEFGDLLGGNPGVERLSELRRVVRERKELLIDGVRVDETMAGAILAAHRSFNKNANRARFAKLPVQEMYEFAVRLVRGGHLTVELEERVT